MTPHDALDATDAADPIDVRPITASDLPDWLRAVKTGFLQEPVVSDEDVENRRSAFILGRTLGAFDGSRCVATFRSFPQELTAVGGAAVPADAISAVTVSPTHRRRGLLTRMMTTDLAAARERGDVVATLIAAEYPIYGRYGFGPVTTTTEWTVDVPRTGLDPRWAGPADGGRVDLLDAEDVRKAGPELHERLRRERPGVINRDTRWWQMNTGLLRFGGFPWKEPFYAAYRSASGEIEGLVSYTSDDNWGDSGQPQNTAEVNWLLAVTPAAERALWSYLCSIDWITRVKTGGAPRRPAAAVPAGPARRPDHHAVGLALGADPGCRTGPGGADVRERRDARARREGRERTGRRPLSAPGRVGRYGDLRADHRGGGPVAVHRRSGDAVARGRVRGAAGGAGPGPGTARGRRPPGRRPAADVQATVVPGHLLNCGCL